MRPALDHALLATFADLAAVGGPPQVRVVERAQGLRVALDEGLGAALRRREDRIAHHGERT